MENVLKYIASLEKLIEILNAENQAHNKCLDTYEKLTQKQNELIMKREIEIANLQREIQKIHEDPIALIEQHEADLAFVSAVFPNVV